MSTRLRALLMGSLHELRHEPIDKRIRAMIGDETVVDTTAALLVWEPRRVVPSYAVPDADIAGEIASAGASAVGSVCDADAPHLLGRPVLDPSIPFSVHTADGEAVAVRVRAGGRDVAGFRAADGEISGHVILDFDGFDAWYEEDERNVSHPRDPFHRIGLRAQLAACADRA
jgi:hypothetical protein